MDVFTSTPACKGGRAKALERSRGKRFVNSLKEMFIQAMISRSAESPMPSGCFYGLARHFSGAEVAVLYQVLRSIKLE